MREVIVQFGPENNMLGIVSEPAQLEPVIAQDKPAIMILNSGLIHKVGPNRMSVTLARKLAELGFLVFRFDLPKIGDSSSYKTSLNYKDRTVSEISQAMDVIEKRYKVKNFISIGLCTGAMNSHVIAAADSRIQGAVLLDAYAYPTFKYLLNRYGNKISKVFNPKIVLGILKGLLKSRHHSDEDSFEEGVDYWKQPQQSDINKDLLNMTSRNVKLLYIYTGGFYYLYNYQNQLRDSFKSIDFKYLLEVHYIEKMDHTYTLQRDREYMLNLIIKWAQTNFSEN